MSYPLPGLFEGFDGITDLEECAGWLSKSANAADSTAAAGVHSGATGNVKSTSPGVLNLPQGNQYLRLEPPRPDIPWEEFIVEAWGTNATTNGEPSLIAIKGGTAVAMMNRDLTAGNIEIRYNSVQTLAATSTGAEAAGTDGHMYSLHAYPAGGAAGFMHAYIDGTLAVSATGLTFTTNNDVDAIELNNEAIGSHTVYYDDLGFRPRTIIVDGVTGGTPSGTISGGTSSESATVYAWETNSSDSASGGGNASLPSGTFRLYLRSVSFGPEATTGGFVDNEVATVTGLTGTVLVYAPLSTYKQGLEPGSQFYYQRLHALSTTSSGVGTENTDGTLEGGATDRNDALNVLDGSEGVSHTATAENVSLALTAFNASAMAEVDEVIGLSVVVTGRAEGGTPETLLPRILDNGASAQNGYGQVCAATNTSTNQVFPADGGGGLWAPTGTGTGTCNSAEPGYETA